MALIGNTVRLEGEYKSFTSQLVDPVTPKLRIYESGKRTPVETIDLLETNRIGLGIYEYYYKIPDGKVNLEYEFSGVIDGHEILGRTTLPRFWVER